MLGCPSLGDTVTLAFRSMLRSQVKWVRPGSPASGCRTMQLSRDSALRGAREGSGRVENWGYGAPRARTTGRQLLVQAVMVMSPLQGHNSPCRSLFGGCT